jgi:DNA-binding winged helix-turn-helix (wHTH) protein/tetratricopeptide (TPR) repeat protein
MDRSEYTVGRLTLQPFHQLLDSGRPVPVKRKALAILSVLAAADGALVTKDQLMAAVWPSITVEDNAIQAHVAFLRKILGPDAELLCTVHGQGYRLIPTHRLPSTETSSEPAQVATSVLSPRRRTVIAAVVLVLIAGIGAGFLYRTMASVGLVRKPAEIGILPSDLSGPQTGLFASDLQDRISADLSLVSIVMASGDVGKFTLSSSSGQPSQQSNAEFLLGSRVNSDGKIFNVRVQISDAEEHVAVWSATFRGSVETRTALLAKVANAVADAAHWAVIGRAGKVRLNAAGVAALIEARGGMSGQGGHSPEIGGPTSTGLEMASYRKIIALAPEFSWGHSGLAASAAFQFRNDPENEALHKEVLQEANRALKLDPNNGEAYVALELAAPRFNWREREVLLLKGAMDDPGFEPAAMHEARLLWAVGRVHDALFWFTRAYQVDPLHNDDNFTYAASLASAGLLADTRKLIGEMDTRWPDNVKTRDAHFWTSVITGATDEALAIAGDPARWPLGMNQESADVWRAALAAQVSKDGTMRASAIKAIKGAGADGSLSRGQALLLLSMLDDVDSAFEQAQYYEPADPKWAPFLFLGPTQAMRFDPRFMPLAVKFGFAAYWRSTGQWPDFCKAPDLPYDCKTEVEKLGEDDPDLKPMTPGRLVMGTY